ncbi:Mu gpG-like protein [Halorubrum tailed virus 28]|uniref:Mu gpG-like protein n=1 Tax=Halorubrum tailed virus 28 TaxID=2878009 RepID=A0AAE8Y0W7_9CAUD|nr:Mu gpG-like protein [Halorubrum tailed virus 28]UBF23466.1 Mu gpG-like protein [Halorubrum tailed virus 28]
MSYDGSDFSEMPAESRIREVAQSELFKQATRFQNEWQDIMLDEGYVNTGETVNSIVVKPSREGADSYTVGTDKIAALIAEFGRRPGAAMPPEEPIADWVNEQSGMPSRGEEDFDNVVFLVRRSIAENGIEAFMPARRAWENVEGKYEENVSKRLSEE